MMAHSPESTAVSGEGETAVRQKGAEWSPDDEIHIGYAETNESRELPTNHLGHKDAPCREFRAGYEDEYVEPMSRPRPIEPFTDPHETVGLVNPDYDQDNPVYSQNCADCARCFERTWRGREEEAGGKAPRLYENSEWEVRGEQSDRTEQWAGEPMSEADAPTIKAAAVRAGHGASGIVHVRFLDRQGKGGGHAYNVVNHEGRPWVVDSQHREVLDWDDRSVHPDLPGTYQMRVMMWDKQGKRVL
jgi:hypothetical protein